MPNTYTQIHIHAVFAVQNRHSVIDDEWKDRLYKYMIAIIQNHEHKVLAIGGMSDHIHILFGMRPTQSLSDLMKVVKGESSKWINENHFVNGQFSWQQGFGAFSYSKSQIPAVIKYINNQQKHHQKVSFIDEYKKTLSDFEIEYNEKYIFTAI